MAKQDTPGTDVAQGRLLDDDALSGIQSFADASAALANAGVTAESFDDYGTGFTVLEDKAQLIRVPFGILAWRFNDGDMGEFVSVELVTEDGRKLVVNDGSTGICAQLRRVADKRIANGMAADDPRVQMGLLVKRGLRVSEYEVENPAKPGTMMAAKTFYLAN